MIKPPSGSSREDAAPRLATFSLIRLTIPGDLIDVVWELGEDIRSLGGVEVEDGFLFQNVNERDTAHEIITSRWGRSFTEVVDIGGHHAFRLLAALASPKDYRDLSMILSAYGLETAIVDRATCCLATLRSYRPSVLVLDCHLQWGGSEGVIECLRDEPELCVPVILLTKARSGNGFGQEPVSHAHPVAACMQHPVDAVRLMHVLRAHTFEQYQSIVRSPERHGIALGEARRVRWRRWV